MENKYKRIVRGAALAVGMLVASVSVWGQEIGDERTLISDITSFWPSNSGYGKSIVNSTDSRALGGGREIVYATSNSSVSLQIQQGGSADNLDGYIRWYVVNNESDITNISVQSVGNLQMPTINNDNAAYEKILQFSNGIAWLRGTHDETYQEYGRRGWQNTGSANDVDDVSPGEICSMSYRIPNNFSTDDEIIVVCEASSLNNVEGQANDNTWTAPMVTFRHVFVIRPASERSNELETMKNNLLNQESGYRGWTSNESVFLRLVAADKSNLFLESYDIHTPLKQGEDLSASEIGTNYRLSEDISNYYVQTTSGRSVQANQVMWRVFNESGEQVTTQTTTGNIWDKSFGTSEGINVDGNETQILYLVAEVSREGGQYPSDGRFPAAFFTIYLEPYTEPLTEGGLASHASDDNYSLRDEDFLERNNYVEVASIQFEETNDVVSMEQMMQNKTLNYAAQPMENANSYYAYAYPGQFQNRRNNRFSVGRGEYGLYRTLNYQQNNNSLSKGDVTINGRTGVYNDWFASNSGVYNKYIFDRTYDRTGEYGYFFYLDATDDPGVITNITLPSSLCPDTRLVVTAWVCDMAHTRTATHADIGITFKGISDNGEETILNRFYSGKIMNKPTEWGANSTYGQAEWQQLYFTFTYQDLGYKSYVLEISNNCPNSDGADYAVDDIKLWRSTPDIRVQRLDACDASTLTISSDYQTILNNMDWTEGQTIDVSGSKNNALAKYRLGFHGARDADGYPQNVNSSYVGNTYFAFIEGLKEDRDGTITAGSDITPYNNPNDPLNPLVITDKGTQHRWVNVNKGLKVDVPISRYSFRVAVSTNAHTGGVSSDPDHWPTTPEDAIRAEKVLNLRAVQDYNYAVENLDNVFGYTPDVDPETNQATAIDLQGLTEENVYLPENEDTYLEVAQELYERLKIPRIRSPWVEESTGMIHLYTMDVTNTDLKFDGELVGYDNNNDPIYADGQYHVILLGAQEVNSWEDSSWEGGSTEPINLEQGCLMMSSFTVYGSVVIRVTTTTDADALVCAGSQRKVSATLVSTEGEQLAENRYSFDWFLGRQETYDNLEYRVGNTVYDLKDAIEYFRDNSYLRGTAFDRGDVKAWNAGDDASAIKEGLLDLFDQDMLRIDTKEFNLILESDTIVAMPFIINASAEENRLYCTEISKVGFNEFNEDVPEIYPGIPTVNYGSLTDIPVRMGLRHLANGTELTIPLRSDIRFSVEGEGHDNTGHVLKELASNKNILLYDVDATGDLTTVGTVVDLFAEENGNNNKLTLQFTASAVNEIKAEGQDYILLVPFGEYANADASTSIGAACDGLAQLHIKIVPEYLTWQDGGTNWYNEGSATTTAAWKQSTEQELFMDDQQSTDANGSDVITDIYSPLYFTKITLLDGDELALEEPTYKDDGLTLDITTDENIEYDMALDTIKAGEDGYTEGGFNITVKPYYINKVSEIYFKPGATLLDQQHLEYDTARVEFNMTNGQSYWLASPLQGVYAGDMYAPTSDGEQKTPAFKHISFNTNEYDRWNPAFYQKGWDKAITYSNVANPYENLSAEGNATKVEAVKSNWSIEYNDVWVPYSIGKGFYARAEEQNVKVRLPKADTDYIYYPNESVTTRALEDKGSRTNSGQLAEISGTGETTIHLTNVDGDGEHFLVGNPYMSYISMDEFFKVNAPDENPTLAKKYWIVNKGVAEVGTPDIEWEETAGHTSGYIAPMQAFFVERAGYNPDSPRDESTVTGSMTITFTTGMMVAQATATNGTTTRAYTAENPQLTLTASSANGKSRAAIVQRSDASNQYESDKDAVTLLDSELDAPTVYTVAGNYAAAVNAIHDYKNVPLGVYADADEDVELTIEGASQLVESLYLYDAVTRSTTPIEGDSYTLNLQGSSHGRYFLTTDEGITVESDIRIYSPADGQLIIASTPSDKLKHVQIYDLSGRVVDSRQNIGMTTCQISVPGGIYIIRAESEHGEAQAKLKVR